MPAIFELNVNITLDSRNSAKGMQNFDVAESIDRWA